ncbi:hypothetical protein SK128_001036 [Halocaridina rubra]|uniref:F-box domain-containing protein n=1 Tax=Halocaridina rubra TaxID=373956 RepID=A0AAN8XDD6_HALRR
MALFAPASLLDLSDDVLLLIFSYLKAWDLIQVAETCERFSKVARDKSLWTNADFSGGCLSLQQLRRWQVFLRPTTRRLVLRGFRRKFAGTPRWKTPLISASVLESIGAKCPDLDELVICEALVDAKKIKIKDFLPVTSVTKFSLIDCEFFNLPTPSVEGSYFKRAHKILPRLEHLKITKCGWIDDYDIMVLSKCDTLKSLVLRNVPKVGREMAHIALGFRFGFQNLEDLDLRGTSLEDHEVLSVVQNGNLKALYLGPVGAVKRLPRESCRIPNIVMPDPRRQEERHQVVVINVGANGPNWLQVNDEELDGMGLQWVRNAPFVQQQRREEEDEDRHYFIGRDGRPLGLEGDNAGQHRGENDGRDENVEDRNDLNSEQNRRQPVSPKAGGAKLCDDNEQTGKSKESNERENVMNKIKEEDGEHEEEEEEDAALQGGFDIINDDDEINDHLQQESHHLPDDGLTDNLIRAFGDKTKQLHTLVLAGCAITDNGLQDVIRLIPSLKFLDITNTKVTSAAVQEARVARPECIIIGGGTRIVRQNDR